MCSEWQEIDITDSVPQNLSEIESLLQINDLSSEGVAQFFPYYLILKSNQTILGVCGLEPYDNVGLIRSLAIQPKMQNKGLGSILLEAMIDKARTLLIDDLYLLTNTAEEFYLKHGFSPISRDLAPKIIQETGEFSHMCPVSSKLMKKHIILP
jgi:amino-acid N-acetyltransferase